MVEHSLSGDFHETDIICAPKLLSVVLQCCRGAVDRWVEPYVRLALNRLSTAEKRPLKDELLLVVANALYYNAELTLGALTRMGVMQELFTGWFTMIFERRWGARKPSAYHACCFASNYPISNACLIHVAGPTYKMHHYGSCPNHTCSAGRHRPKGTKPAHFRQQQDKKVCVLGLASILAVPDAALPPEVASGLPQLLAGIMKLLMDLKAQQDEAEERANEDADEEDEDEVSHDATCS